MASCVLLSAAMPRGWFAIVIVVAMSGKQHAIASPGLGLAEPVAPPIGEVLELGPSPTYYRIPPNVVTFASRSALGTQTRWTDGDSDTSFALDLLVGSAIRFGRDSNAGLWIEGGYAWVKGHEHLVVLGVGPAHRSRGRIAALVPHVVAGRVDGETAIGARTSLFGSVGPYGLELAHQLTLRGDERIHELHVALTFPYAGLE